MIEWDLESGQARAHASNYCKALLFTDLKFAALWMGVELTVYKISFTYFCYFY